MDLTNSVNADADDPQQTAESFGKYPLAAGLTIGAFRVGEKTIGTATEGVADWGLAKLKSYADEATTEANDGVSVL